MKKTEILKGKRQEATYKLIITNIKLQKIN